MGCDIHLRAEVRRDGKWIEVVTGTRRKYGEDESGDYVCTEVPDPTTVIRDGLCVPDINWEGSEEDMCDKYGYQNEFYEGRNYGLFSVLAGVRNYNDVTPICEPRGLPEDVSDTVKIDAVNWGTAGHSHTYLTLKEILDYNWDEELNQCSGIMSEAEYLNLKKVGGVPPSYCRGVGGPNVITVTEEQYMIMVRELFPENQNRGEMIFPEPVKDKSDGFFAGLFGDDGPVSAIIGKSVFVEASWYETKRMMADGYWWDRTIPALQQLDPNPENVRIVFWFDN